MSGSRSRRQEFDIPEKIPHTSSFQALPAWCAYKADLALQGVLAELVTPDELRANELHEWKFSTTPTGEILEEQEAALLGWDTYQDK
jgi:hypothetical protein